MATKWDTVKDKIWFARQFIKFVERGFQRGDFPKKFYNRLSLCFGHIAHYDQDGFYAYFFTTTEDKVRFIKQTLQWSCCGDPTFTYSDVEQELQGWLFVNKFKELYEERLANETKASELATLNYLKKKYEPVS